MLSLYVFYCNILNLHEKALWTTTVCWSLLDRSEPKSNAWLHIVQCRYVHVCTKFTDFFTDWLLSKNGLYFFPSDMKQQELDSLSLSLSLCNDKTSSPSLHSQHCSSEVGQPCWSGVWGEVFFLWGFCFGSGVLPQTYTQLQTHIQFTREVKTNDQPLIIPGKISLSVNL